MSNKICINIPFLYVNFWRLQILTQNTLQTKTLYRCILLYLFYFVILFILINFNLFNFCFYFKSNDIYIHTPTSSHNFNHRHCLCVVSWPTLILRVWSKQYFQINWPQEIALFVCNLLQFSLKLAISGIQLNY